MVHGMATNMAFWYFNYGLPLSKRYRITLYDLRGHGRSDDARCRLHAGRSCEATSKACSMDHLHIEKART